MLEKDADERTALIAAFVLILCLMAIVFGYRALTYRRRAETGEAARADQPPLAGSSSRHAC